ncbi:MAG: hypothetical protein KAS39_07545, partial [Actinomycetia bacterium]|nr:hypothetical protein [Actinomycetes bacterium]
GPNIQKSGGGAPSVQQGNQQSSSAGDPAGPGNIMEWDAIKLTEFLAKEIKKVNQELWNVFRSVRIVKVVSDKIAFNTEIKSGYIVDELMKKTNGKIIHDILKHKFESNFTLYLNKDVMFGEEFLKKNSKLDNSNISTEVKKTLDIMKGEIVSDEKEK